MDFLRNSPKHLRVVTGRLKGSYPLLVDLYLDMLLCGPGTTMPDKFDILIQDLDRLALSNCSHLGVFGEEVHRYQRNKPLSEEELTDFETKHNVRLPLDYSQFLTCVGNGGVGPYYGLFKLGEMDDGYEFAPWPNFMIGQLSTPFPHTSSWNDLTGRPKYPSRKADKDAYDKRIEAFDARYWDTRQIDGAIPICHLGCALRQWLVITGPEAGNIWCDDRADHKGLYPLQSKGRNRVTFFEWYRDWLDDALSKLQHLET